jgi:hypothetical protein
VVTVLGKLEFLDLLDLLALLVLLAPLAPLALLVLLALLILDSMKLVLIQQVLYLIQPHMGQEIL